MPGVETLEDNPPPGFLRIDFDRGRPEATFNGHVGPLYAKRGDKGTADEFVLGFRVHPRMCNPAGGLHGGMMMTVADLVGGQLQMGVTGAPVVMPMAARGKLRALGISSAKRSEAFPDLPTIAEAGFKGFEADQWYGITGPAGIDPAIALRLNQEINKAVDSADVRARLQKEGGSPVLLPPDALGQHIASEIARWRPVVQAANIRLE